MKKASAKEQKRKQCAEYLEREGVLRFEGFRAGMLVLGPA